MIKGGRPPRGWDAERLIAYLPLDLKRRLGHLAVEKRCSLTAAVTTDVETYLRRRRIPTLSPLGKRSSPPRGQGRMW